MFRQPLLRRHLTVKVPRNHGTIGVQRVEVSKKPRTTPRKFILQVFLFYCAYTTIKLAIYGPDPEVKSRLDEIQRRVEQRKKELAKQKGQPKTSDSSKEHNEAFAKAKAFGQGDATAKKQPSEQDPKPLMIPIPLWTKQLDKKPYKPDSPEVKAFHAFKQDDKAVMKLYKVFDEAVTTQLQQERSHVAALKYVNYSGNVSRNLNIGAMLFHPTTYAIRCIVFKPNGDVGLEWKEMRPEAGSRMQKISHPVIMSKAFVSGVWAFTKTTFAITKAKVLDLIYPRRDLTIEVKYANRRQWQILASIIITRPPSHEDNVIGKLPSARYSDASLQRRFPFLKGELEKDSNREAIRSQIQSVTHEYALQHSVDMFKRAWVAGQLKAQRLDTPGAVNIIGFYDMHGTNGRYRVEVYGRYLPGEDTLIGPPQITRGHVLVDTAIPKNNQNIIAGKKTPNTAPSKAKPQIPDDDNGSKPKPKPDEAQESPKPDNTPEPTRKPAAPEKESEKKAKE